MKLPLPVLLILGFATSSLTSTALPGAIVMASQDTDVYRFTTFPSSSTGDLDVSKESSAPHTFRSFLEFDLASLGYTAGQPVTSAQLWLYTTSVTSGGTIRLQDITSDWTVAGFNWNTQPTVGSFLTDTTVSTAGTWYSFDITSLVQQWVNDSSSNYGIRLSSPDDAQVKFISNDATTGNEGYRPYVSVTPEPGRTVLLAAAFGLVGLRRHRSRPQPVHAC